MKGGVNVNAKDSNCRTPLWWAAGNGHLEVTNLLIQQKGVDLCSEDSSGRTPLSWAAENGHLEIFELLKAKLSSNP
jgi:ankyrin repeat protein